METSKVGETEVIIYTREELWEVIDGEARRLLGMDAATFVRKCREGQLPDNWMAAELRMLVDLGRFAETGR